MCGVLILSVRAQKNLKGWPKVSPQDSFQELIDRFELGGFTNNTPLGVVADQDGYFCGVAKPTAVGLEDLHFILVGGVCDGKFIGKKTKFAVLAPSAVSQNLP